MTTRQIFVEDFTGDLSAYTELSGIGTIVINGDNRLEFDQTGFADWFTSGRSVKVLTRDFSLNPDENEVELVVDMHAVTQATNFGEFKFGFYQDDQNIYYGSMAQNFAFGRTVINNVWESVPSFTETQYPRLGRIRFRRPRQGDVSTRSYIDISYYNTTTNQWIVYHNSFAPFFATKIFFCLKSHTGGPVTEALLNGYTLIARSTPDISSDFSDNFDDNVYSMEDLGGISLSGDAQETSGRLQIDVANGQPSDWWSFAQRQALISVLPLRLLRSHKKVTMTIDCVSVTGTTNDVRGMFGIYQDDKNNAGIHISPTGGISAITATNNAFNTRNTVVQALPRSVRIILGMSGPATGASRDSITMEYYDGADWQQLYSSFLEILPEKLYIGNKGFGGSPGSQSIWDNLTIEFETADSLEIRDILVDDFETASPVPFLTLSGVGNLSKSNGAVLLETPLGQGSNWFEATPREGLLPYIPLNLGVRDRRVFYDINIRSVTQSTSTGEFFFGFHLNDQNFFAWVRTTSGFVPVVSVADSWTIYGFVSASQFPTDLRVVFNNPTFGNPNPTQQIEFLNKNSSGVWVSRATATIPFIADKGFIYNKSFGGTPQVQSFVESIYLQSTTLGSDTQVVYDDGFTNATEDFDKLLGDGTITEPAGTLSVITVSPGDDVTWSSVEGRKGVMAKKDLVVTPQDEFVYIEAEYIVESPANGQGDLHFGLYQDDLNTVYIQMQGGGERVSPFIRQSGTATILNVSVYEAFTGKVRLVWDIPNQRVFFYFFRTATSSWEEIAIGGVSIGSMFPAAVFWGFFGGEGSTTISTAATFGIDRVLASADVVDNDPPVLSSSTPIDGTTGVLIGDDITVIVEDTAGLKQTGVDSDVVIEIKESTSSTWIPMYQSETAQSGYAVTVNPSGNGFRFDINPDADLVCETTYDVRVTVTDSSPQMNSTQHTFSFTTEDCPPPVSPTPEFPTGPIVEDPTGVTGVDVEVLYPRNREKGVSPYTNITMKITAEDVLPKDEIFISMKLGEQVDPDYPKPNPNSSYSGDISEEFLKEFDNTQGDPDSEGFTGIISYDTDTSSWKFHNDLETVETSVSEVSDKEFYIQIKLEKPLGFGTTNLIKTYVGKTFFLDTFNISSRDFYSPDIGDARSAFEPYIDTIDWQAKFPLTWFLRNTIYSLFDERAQALSTRRLVNLVLSSPIGFSDINNLAVQVNRGFRNVYFPDPYRGYNLREISLKFPPNILDLMKSSLREIASKDQMPPEWYSHLESVLDIERIGVIHQVRLAAQLVAIAARFEYGDIYSS